MCDIQVTQPSMPPFDEYVEMIKDLWDSKNLTNRGSKHEELEDWLNLYLDTPNIELFTNGHLALETALSAFGLTGEVITTPFTSPSTVQAIIRSGLLPVFCDINEEDYTIDVGKIEELITEHTSAILPVHIYGHVCDVQAIEEIAQKHRLKVIYDGGHAFGVTVDDQGIGNFGDASVFSFHAAKVFNTIEGGAVTYNDPDLSESLKGLGNLGQTDSETVEYIGGNAKMNEFQAAMGLCNIRYVDDNIEKRKQIVERYIVHLKDIEGIKLVPEPKEVKSSYAHFPVVFDGYKKTRDEVDQELRRNRIMARKYFPPLTNKFPAYNGHFEIVETPVAEYISQHNLTLPLYSDLSLEDVDRICKIILN